MPPGQAALATSMSRVSATTSRERRPLLEPLQGLKAIHDKRRASDAIERTLHNALSAALKKIGLHGAKITGCEERKDSMIFRYTYAGKERMICLGKTVDTSLGSQDDHVHAAEQALRLMGADKSKIQ